MISIVVPCYNEEDNLLKLIEQASFVASEAAIDIEFVFVDNGSTDNTEQVLKELIEQSPHRSCFRSVRVPVNQGYGNGILCGLREAGGEVLSWTHADLQTDLMDPVRALEEFGEELRANHVVVKGRRVGRSILDVFFTWGMSMISSIALSKRLSDVNAQPKVFHRDFFSRMEEPPEDFSLDLYLLVLAHEEGVPIRDFPVSFLDREAGEAKGGGSLKGKWKLIVRTWNYILKLRRKMNH